jgi:hypothetical protein
MQTIRSIITRWYWRLECWHYDRLVEREQMVAEEKARRYLRIALFGSVK